MRVVIYGAGAIGGVIGGRLFGPVEGVTRLGGSSWQSLARGLGSIETDYLNGEIVLLGRLHGVPTPANELLQRLAREAAAARRPPGHVPVDELLSEIETEKRL